METERVTEHKKPAASATETPPPPAAAAARLPAGTRAREQGGRGGSSASAGSAGPARQARSAEPAGAARAADPAGQTRAVSGTPGTSEPVGFAASGERSRTGGKKTKGVKSGKKRVNRATARGRREEGGAGAAPCPASDVPAASPPDTARAAGRPVDDAAAANSGMHAKSDNNDSDSSSGSESGRERPRPRPESGPERPRRKPRARPKARTRQRAAEAGRGKAEEKPGTTAPGTTAPGAPGPSRTPEPAGGSGKPAPLPPTPETGAVTHPPTGDEAAAEAPPAATSAPCTAPEEERLTPRSAVPVPNQTQTPAPAATHVVDPDAAERERRGGDRLRFVGAATRRIARGMDLDETVLGLCRASVPAYSDAILVYLRDPLPVGDEHPTGPVVLRLRRSDRIPDDPQALIAASSASSGAASTPAPGAGSAPSADGGDQAQGGTATPTLAAISDGTAGAAEYAEVRAGGPLAEVLRGVRPVFADTPAAHAALPELLGTGGNVPTGNRAILAPLRGRRRVIGAAVFLRRPERPAFEPDDLLIAAQLATHTALGVDKAVLYGREAYIADELQRTMLPDELPQPTGCHLASRYLPAAETARVGGDWYDAIPLPGSRVALVVGDVMGHSMTSAAIMGQLRTTAQTLAGLDLPPQEVLHHLDEQAQRLGYDRMATCTYAVYDPVAHRIVIANAGHPPPVLLHRDGRAEVLRIPAGAPIGVGGVDFEAVELDAPAGATLLLYTDGLVESRQRDVWTGIEHLRERLEATAALTRPDTSAPLEPLCDEVLDILGPGDRDDDIALLAARFDGITPSDVAYWFLDPRAQTAGQARRLARRALARWDLEDLSDSVELLVSEVVTNAVRYAERPITLRLLRTDTLRCEVGDDVPQLPRLRQARATDEGGRGLYLVNRLARRWGATRLSTGKVVWFELPLE
jgi:serine phosphatase RsbU (regulator of sigma subunit)/anti-sigma regulatory factor (Ser/Thr protein kinase)